jgi:hypothetical protein
MTQEDIPERPDLGDFFNTEGHLSVEDVYALVKKKDKKAGVEWSFEPQIFDQALQGKSSADGLYDLSIAMSIPTIII